MFAERSADFIPGAYVNVIREVEGTDRMTFVNHNRPLPPVTIEDLNERESFDERGCVNSELKGMFFALGLIESFGSEETFAETAPRNIAQGHWPRTVSGSFQQRGAAGG